MINMNEIITTTNTFLVEEFEADAELMKPEASLRDVLDLDSLDYIDLAVAIENNFHFKVQPGDFVPLVTFGDFYHYIADRVVRKETA